MNRESQARFVAVLLFLLTVAAVVFAGFNFEKERDFAVPDDGVWWVEHDGRLIADRVDPNGPGARGGIKEDDQLVAVNGEDVKSTPGLVRQLYHSGVWSKAVYSLHAAIGDAGFQRVPDSGGPLSEQLPALHRADLSGNRPVRSAATLDGDRFDALLYFLRGFVHRLLVPLHGKIERLRLDHLLEQHCRLGIAAGDVPAFRPDLSGEAEIRAGASVDAVAGLCAGRGPDRETHHCTEAGAGQRSVALGHGPAGNGVWRRSVHRCRDGSVVQLPAGQHDHPAATIEVGDARNDSRGGSLHVVLRAAVTSTVRRA